MKYFLLLFVFLSSSAFSKNCRTQFKNKMLTYEQAKNLIQELGVWSFKDYHALGKQKTKELKLPWSVRNYYKKTGDWQGAKDFFGESFLTYKQAQEKVQELGIRNEKEYSKMDKKKLSELQLPYNPRVYYQKTGEWRGAYEFFGESFLTYKQARDKVRELGIRSLEEYRALGKQTRQSLRLHSNPTSYYQKTGEWRGAYEFFGTQKIELLSYEQAKNLMRELEIQGLEEYRALDKQTRQSLGLHSDPSSYYIKKGEWQGAKDFFGTKILTYEQAKILMREFGIRSVKEYKLIIRGEKRKSLGLPSKPETYYIKKGEWQGAKDFFGTKILTYEQAKILMRELGIKNEKEYRLMSKEKRQELNLPTRPRDYYALTGKWVNAKDFFGDYRKKNL